MKKTAHINLKICYPLANEREDYCQAQTGMALEKYRQELCSEEPSMEQGHQM